jgi:Zn-dependent protease with chaperone function
VRTSFRALLAVALLAGFPLLVLAVTAAIVVGEVYLVRYSFVGAAKLAILGVPVVFALLRALFVIERDHGDAPPGPAVTPEAQPELWALVRELAAEVGTRPPDEIYLVPEVNAGVLEQTRWLGLSVVRRRMFVGAQLFAGLRRDQLCALLGHELAHYSNRDTRLSGLTYRGRRSILAAVVALGGRGWFAHAVRSLFAVYARLYFSVSSRVCRRQELAADAAAARLAGTAATTSVLREVDALAVSWRFFMDRYALAGWHAGYLPDRFAHGFQSLLADESRAGELDELRRNPPDRPVSPYDSHPPTAERIAAIEALPAVPPRPGGERPASEILRDAAATLDAALVSNLTDEARAKRRTDWESLVNVGARHAAAEAARAILGTRTLGAALDLLDAGRPEELADPELTPPAGAGPRARREFAAGSVRARLSTVVSVALVDAGVARFALSWSGPAEFTADDPYGAGLPGALDAAVAGDTGPLRALLAAAGVAVGYRPAAPART